VTVVARARAHRGVLDDEVISHADPSYERAMCVIWITPGWCRRPDALL
jgi:hypothetical protein